MKDDELDTIIEKFPDAARNCVEELREHILEAAAQALINTQETEDGGKPKVVVAVRLVIALHKIRPEWQVKASVGVKYGAETSPALLEDSNQLSLFAPGTTVTIAAEGMEPITLSKKKASSR